MKNFHTILTISGAVIFHALLTFCTLGSPANYAIADDGTVKECALGVPANYAIADDTTLKGKGQDGECMDYALSLSSRLAANGIHGRLIFYRWHIRNTSITGSHVLVEYRLPNGSEWIVDNEIPHPKRVPSEATPMELVFLLSGDAYAPVDVELQDGLNHLSYF
jgi:hypothetical protein